MLTILQWVLVALGSLMAAGTLASLSRSPHWAAPKVLSTSEAAQGFVGRG